MENKQTTCCCRKDILYSQKTVRVAEVCFVMVSPSISSSTAHTNSCSLSSSWAVRLNCKGNSSLDAKIPPEAFWIWRKNLGGSGTDELHRTVTSWLARASEGWISKEGCGKPAIWGGKRTLLLKQLRRRWQLGTISNARHYFTDK